MRTLRWTALFVGLCACACDAPAEGADGGRDAGMPGDAGAQEDGGSDAGPDDAGPADGGRADGAAAREDAGAPEDAGTDAGASDGGGVPDASPRDAGSVYLGEVACRSTAECASGQVCDMDAPGGRCQGLRGDGELQRGLRVHLRHLPARVLDRRGLQRRDALRQLRRVALLRAAHLRELPGSLRVPRRLLRAAAVCERRGLPGAARLLGHALRRALSYS
ncbi:MAG: hypothetical protein M5U28_50765 [Sandaracinaceae bacterium]|nr:hypothetical protein [Sandaracinaceae bacterium]